MLSSHVLQQHRFGERRITNVHPLHENPCLPRLMKPTMKLSGHNGCINTCNFNPYGDKLITGCDDGSVWIWNIGMHRNKPEIMLKPNKTNVFTTNFLSNSSFISGGNDASVNYVRIAPDRVVKTEFINHHTRKIMDSVIVDQNTFITCSFDQTFRIFDIRQSYGNTIDTELPILKESDYTNRINLASLDSDIRKYNLKTQFDGGGYMSPLSIPVCRESLLYSKEKSPDAHIFSMDMHPTDKKQFIASLSNGSVQLFDLRSIYSNAAAVGYSCSYDDPLTITGAAYNRKGDKIAASALNSGIYVFDAYQFTTLDHQSPAESDTAEESEPERIIPEEEEEAGDDFYPDDDEDFFPGVLHQMIVFDSLMDLIYNVDHSNNNSPALNVEILISDNNEEENNSDNESESESSSEPERFHGQIHHLKDHHSCETVKKVSWFDDYIITGTDDGRVAFYDVENEKIIVQPRHHVGNVNVVAVHPEKLYLATSGIDDFAQLWEPVPLSNNKDHIDTEFDRLRNPFISNCSVM